MQDQKPTVIKTPYGVFYNGTGVYPNWFPINCWWIECHSLIGRPFYTIIFGTSK